MKVYTKIRTVQLSDGTKLNEEIVRRFDNFFTSIDPLDFRNTLLEIYHNYLIREHQALPVNFDQMAIQMYLFIDLLGREDRNSYPIANDEQVNKVHECDIHGWLLQDNLTHEN